MAFIRFQKGAPFPPHQPCFRSLLFHQLDKPDGPTASRGEATRAAPAQRCASSRSLTRILAPDFVTDGLRNDDFGNNFGSRSSKPAFASTMSGDALLSSVSVSARHQSGHQASLPKSVVLTAATAGIRRGLPRYLLGYGWRRTGAVRPQGQSPAVEVLFSSSRLTQTSLAPASFPWSDCDCPLPRREHCLSLELLPRLHGLEPRPDWLETERCSHCPCQFPVNSAEFRVGCESAV